VDENGVSQHSKIGRLMSEKGSIASILACRQHVRFAVNIGSAGCPSLPVEGIGLAGHSPCWRSTRRDRYLLGFTLECSWRDPPETCGLHTTCYNRFVQWRQAGFWDRIMDALAAGHDPTVQMIDTSIVGVHQHGACVSGLHQARINPRLAAR
jgi:hypothetical protein